MRRLLLWGVLILAALPAIASAEEIGISVTAPTESGNEGDSCEIYAPRLFSNFPVRWFDGTTATSLIGQVTIENERHEVIALIALDDGKVLGEDPICSVKATLDVPEAAFYTILINGQRITTIPADQASADRVLVVTFDD